MKKSAAILLLLALFSSSHATDVRDSEKVIGCVDKVSGSKFIYNLSTFTWVRKKNGVMWYTVYDSVGVKHTLSTTMTQTYLTCKELER